MTKKLGGILALIGSLILAVPAFAQPALVTQATNSNVKNDWTIKGNLKFTTTGAATGKVTTITAPQPAANRTLTIPDVGATTGTFVMTSGAANGIVAKAKEFGANFGPQNAALTDSNTYTVVLAPARAGVVQKISFACRVVPSGGTCTIAIKKNNNQTMLNAATFDLTTLVADTITAGTLTATTADLTLTATDTITCSVVTGTTTTDIQAPTATIEMLPNDY